MKQTLVIFNLLFFSSFSSFSQQFDNHIEYFNLCNLGDKYYYFENFNEAIESYESAFEKADYVHAHYYMKAAKTCVKSFNYSKAYFYSKKAILNGQSDKFLKNKEFKQFRKTSEYRQLKDSLKFFKKEYALIINNDYKVLIDSLYYVDQRIIRNNRSCKGNYQIDKSILPDNLYELDSVIFADLLTLVENYGFPSERLVGPESYRHAFIIFHHNIRLKKNEKYLDLLESAVKKGEYMPEHFAWTYDQGLLMKGKKPYFYYGVAFLGNLTESEQEEVDKHRKDYGVKPIESFEVIEKGKTIIQKPLW